MAKQGKKIAQKSKSSFLSSFKFLPPQKRSAIYTVYAWCRKTDDIVDSSRPEEQKTAALNAWQRELDETFNGSPQTQLSAELKNAVTSFAIEKQYFDDMIAAMRNDIDPHPTQSWEDLLQYCYGVASTVGLMAIEIFGYQNQKTRQFAKNLGIALQLTNICRDVKKDAQIGRIYIPAESLQKHGVSEEQIRAGEYSQSYLNLMTEFSAEAGKYFTLAKQNLPKEDLHAMRPSLIMGEIYFRLRRKLHKHHFNVFDRDINLSGMEKWSAALKGWFFPGRTL